MDEISNKLYIKDKVNTLLSDMMVDVVRSKPDDALEFMIGWIRAKRHPDKNKAEDEQLKTYQSIIKQKKIIEETKAIMDNKVEKSNAVIENNVILSDSNPDNQLSEPSSKQFQEIANIAIIQPPPAKSSLTPSNSIIQLNSPVLVNQLNRVQEDKVEISLGSEPLIANRAKLLSPQNEELIIPISKAQSGSAEKSEQARFIQKTKEQMSSLTAAYQQCRFFACLDNPSIIIGALEQRAIKAGEYVINQGDEGDELFLIVEGSFDCTRKTRNGSEFVRNLNRGQIFGELSLLYDQKRSASIQANVDSIIYSLDKETFVNHAKIRILENRDKYIKFLNTVRIFNKCPSYDLVLIADNVRSLKFKRNDVIIREGDQPDYFYLVEVGFLKATKLVDNLEQDVYQFQPGDYFGEIALLRQGKRTATVTCKSDCVLLGIDADVFKTFPVNILDSLRINAERYIYWQKMEPSRQPSFNADQDVAIVKEDLILKQESVKEESIKQKEQNQVPVIKQGSLNSQKQLLQKQPQQVLKQDSIMEQLKENQQYFKMKQDSLKDKSLEQSLNIQQQLIQNSQVHSEKQINQVDLQVNYPIQQINQEQIQENQDPNQNKKVEYMPPQIARFLHKNKEQMSRLTKKMQQCSFFSCLDKGTQDIMMGAMEEKKFKEHDFIIKQGDDGDELYLIDQGLFDCYKKSSPNHDNKWVKSYQPGQVFGELALLYDQKRAATIQGKTDSVLWCLDRATFTEFAKSIILEKRSITQFLDTIPVFKSLDPYELMQIADCLRTVNYQQGDEVIKQGVAGDYFYLIKSGTLQALKLIDNVQTEVFNFQAGDYFGEMSLLKDVNRQASIVCQTDCVLLLLEKSVFKRLPISLLNDIRKNSERYPH